VSGKMGAKLEK